MTSITHRSSGAGFNDAVNGVLRYTGTTGIPRSQDLGTASDIPSLRVLTDSIIIINI